MCFTLGTLNNIDVLATGITYAYLNAKPLGNCYAIVQDDFVFGSSSIGERLLIFRALYEMKLSRNIRRFYLASILDMEVAYKQCYANNDVWIKTTTSNIDFEYMFIYVIH